VPAPPIKTGADKAKDADNSDLTWLPLDPLEARPTMPVSNAGKQDISLETVCTTAKDALGQISLISMTNLIPMKSWNLLIRLPKSATSSTQ